MLRAAPTLTRRGWLSCRVPAIWLSVHLTGSGRGKGRDDGSEANDLGGSFLSMLMVFGWQRWWIWKASAVENLSNAKMTRASEFRGFEWSKSRGTGKCMGERKKGVGSELEVEIIGTKEVDVVRMVIFPSICVANQHENLV